MALKLFERIIDLKIENFLEQAHIVLELNLKYRKFFHKINVCFYSLKKQASNF